MKLSNLSDDNGVVLRLRDLTEAVKDSLSEHLNGVEFDIRDDSYQVTDWSNWASHEIIMEATSELPDVDDLDDFYNDLNEVVSEELPAPPSDFSYSVLIESADDDEDDSLNLLIKIGVDSGYMHHPLS